MEQEHKTKMEESAAFPVKSSEGRSANLKIFLFGFMGLIGVVAVLAILVSVYRVYAKQPQDNFSLSIAKALNLPAAKVNGVAISYIDYAMDLKAIHKMNDFSKSSGADAVNYTDEQMSDQVLLRLANNIIVKEAAGKYGLAVNGEDVDGLQKQVLQQFKTTAEADTELIKRYGWDLKTYTNRVMKPFILENKLAQKVNSDEAARAAIKAKAENVLAQIKGGSDFTEMAKQYGEDGTAAKGGDLGYFSKGDMVPAFEDAAFALKKGELSQAIVETQYGYHILQVLDRKTESVKLESGKSSQKESVQARHILFRYPSLDRFLGDLIKQANMHLYLSVHNPFNLANASTTTK